MEELVPHREVADPIINMSEPKPYEMLHDLGMQMFPWGRKYSLRSVFVDELNHALLVVIEKQRERAPSPLSAVGIWHMGANTGHWPDAAYPWADKEYMLTVDANWESIENSENLEWARTTEQ